MQNLTLAIAVIAAIAAAPAAGQSVTDPIERVSVSDLDLTSADGRRLLARRISRATEFVCGSYAGARDVIEIDAIDQCRRRARAEVAEQVAVIVKHHATRLASR